MNHVTKTLVGALVLLVASGVDARKVPQKQIPPSVLMELRVIETQFKDALRNDCAPERCFMNGCAYQDHITLDQPRTASLPGLPAEEGPGSVDAQEYLTRVRCEFSHEATVKKGDVNKLARRLEKRLSRGWLTVVVAPQELEPIPKSLAESPPDEEEDKEDEEPPPPPPPEPEELTTESVARQLWDALLPHAWWMTAIFLLTFATLILIWASRRLGAQSLEDRMLEAQLQSGAAPDEQGASTDETTVVEAPPPASEEKDFVEEQERIWAERLDRVAPGDEDDVISRLLREWLKMGDYATLARALLIFGDRVSQAFEAVPELAIKKVEFANYFRDVDESTLPSRAKFYRHLNQQAMASLLLSQEDVQLYRSLREDFGASGFVSLMRDLPPRYGALLFALMGYDQQQEVAALLTTEMRNALVRELLASTRISLKESAYLSQCLEAVQEGAPLPEAPPAGTVVEHGPPIDSAAALSVVLPHVSAAERVELFEQAQAAHGGALPAWYEDIAFNHMLTSLGEEMRNDLLLSIDIRSLAAWLQMQPPKWRRAFTAELSGPLQNALARSSVTGSRADLIRWAKRGQSELVTAFKSLYARQGVRFVDLVA